MTPKQTTLEKLTDERQALLREINAPTFQERLTEIDRKIAAEKDAVRKAKQKELHEQRKPEIYRLLSEHTKQTEQIVLTAISLDGMLKEQSETEKRLAVLETKPQRATVPQSLRGGVAAAMQFWRINNPTLIGLPPNRTPEEKALIEARENVKRATKLLADYRKSGGSDKERIKILGEDLARDETNLSELENKQTREK